MPIQNSTPNIDKNEIKLGEKKLKSIIGGKIIHNADFIRLMKVNGISNTAKTWNRINDQIRQELNQGLLTYEDVPQRVNQLVLIESPTDRLITLEEVDAIKIEETKRKMLAKGKLYIQIPYQSNGVSEAIVGQAFLGKTGAVLGALNDGQTQWRGTDLVFINGGFNIKSTGNTILYDDIKSANLGDGGFIYTPLSILTHDGRQLIFKAPNLEAAAFFSIVKNYIDEKNIKSANEDRVVQMNDDADLLLKYAELYEKGLITFDEFNQKKEQIFANENDNINVENPENNLVYCKNCGCLLDEGSNFCSNCGTRII